MDLEFRVYHDDDGKVLFYSMERPEGQYIVITRQQYLEGRTDCIVNNGVLQSINQPIPIQKYQRNLNGEITTSKYDINVLVNTDGTNWTYQ
jgi:hypothetical protein